MKSHLISIECAGYVFWHLISIECAGYVFWQLFLRDYNYMPTQLGRGRPERHVWCQGRHNILLMHVECFDPARINNYVTPPRITRAFKLLRQRLLCFR